MDKPKYEQYKWLKNLQDSPNNMSNWLPKFVNDDDDGINIPFTLQLFPPEEVIVACFMDNGEKDARIIYEYVKSTVLPKLKEAKYKFPGSYVFLKNGSLSNKFDFSCCKILVDEFRLTSSIIEINYMDFMYDVGGATELNFREFIDTGDNVPTIYSGMPLVPEYRVFYDFDARCFLYEHEYWNYDYCHKRISEGSASDKIVYESYYPVLKSDYNTQKDYVLSKVIPFLNKQENMAGKWSIDFLFNPKDRLIWFIDAATAETSAYWDEGGHAHG